MENFQMREKLLNNCSKSLAIREPEIKTTSTCQND